MDLRGKVAVVTGGGTGIGSATAQLLAEQGVNVVVAGRRIEPLQAVVGAIEERPGGRALAVPADLTREDDAQALIARVLEVFGRLDLAVNAAGGVAVGSLVDMDEAAFDEVLAASLKTIFLALKHELPAIAAAGGGAIVNVASRAGLVGVQNGSAYSAAKHGVIGLTKSAALEAAAVGVRVNAVCPGPVRTEQFERIVGEILPGTPVDEAAVQFGAKLPLGRIGDPSDIAAAIVYLLGPAASFTTGVALPVDGGGSAG